MYSFAIYLYMLAVGIAALFNKRARKLAIGHQYAFVRLKRLVEKDARYIWFHAASLGEFEQGRPLMERLRREHPEYKILLTFFSPSGYEVRKDWEGADIVCYLPLDTPTNVRIFFHYVKPEMLFLIKYEFWHNYLQACRRRGIPVYSVSSIFRPGQIFFRWYGRLGGYRRVLNCITYFFVQNQQSKDLLATLGHTDNVTIVGDTRFDRVLDIRRAAKPLPLVERFAKDYIVFVAGSSWPPDEALLIPWFKSSRVQKFKGSTPQPSTLNSQLSTLNSLRLIIAPHQIGEDHLRAIEQALQGCRVLRYSKATEDNVAEADVLIIDCFGLLSSIYRYATVTYVGGGFGVGIHNTVEAAVWGVPVIFGPNNQRFQEAQELKGCNGGFEVSSYDDFCRLMDRFASDAEALRQAGEAAGGYVRHKAGATRMILDAVKL